MEETVPISEPGVLLEDEGDQRGIKITGLRFKVRVRESELLNAGYIARLITDEWREGSVALHSKVQARW
jgi:hypothetical protein